MKRYTIAFGIKGKQACLLAFAAATQLPTEAICSYSIRGAEMSAQVFNTAVKSSYHGRKNLVQRVAVNGSC